MPTTKPTRPDRSILETFPAPDGVFVDRFECPEFTCLCPKTGQPDFARLTLWYLPAKLCVELKSLKLYLWAFRDVGAFHERVTNEIADDLMAVLDAAWLLVEGDFWVRGGIHTTVFAVRDGDGAAGLAVPDALLTARMAATSYQAGNR